MKLVSNLRSFLASRALTVWLVGVFVVYYLTVSVWSSEAFGKFIINLGSNNLYRLPYLLFLLNVSLRIIFRLKASWKVSKKNFFFKLPLSVGLILVLTASFLSVNIRQSQWLVVGEGDVIRLPWEPSLLHVVHIDSALQKKALRQENSPIFDYEPVITLEDERGNLHSINAFPAVRVNSSYLHILYFGIGPGVEVRKGGQPIFRGEYSLRLVPFGNVDVFQVDQLPYKFYLSVIPNRTIKRGKETARDYDLNSPRYHLEIARGDKIIVKSDVDHQLSFEGNTLSFFKPADWVLLDAIYDPCYIWLVSGLLMVALGILFYPFALLSD